MEKNKPFFSIIVPTFNRPDKLADCLESLARLDYPKNRFHVVVVDDGSKVTPEPVVSRFFNRLDVTLLKQAHAGPAAARNNGAKKARGKFLIFLDDDCSPAPDRLLRLQKRFKETPDAAIGGKTLGRVPFNIFSATSQMIINAVYDFYNKSVEGPHFFTTNNLAVPVDSFWNIGGFNSSFTTAEDREFCHRWKSNRYRLIYAPEIIIYHVNPLTFLDFLRCHYRHGQGAFRFHYGRNENHTRNNQEVLKFYLHLLSCPFSKELNLRMLLVGILIILAKSVYVGGYFTERFRFMRNTRSSKHE
jgi:glycosyltransferase involved in cell wall biosynthesis